MLDLADGFWEQGGAILDFFVGKHSFELMVVHYGKLGFYLKYTDPDLNSWMSCADRKRLKKVVDIDDEAFISEGLFLPVALAWEAVKEFLEKGTRHKKVDWIRQKDMPPEGNW